MGKQFHNKEYDNMAAIGFVLILFGTLILIISYTSKNPTNSEIANRIITAFDNVDLSSNSFSFDSSSYPITNKYGESKFYRQTQVDMVVDNLNNIVKDLRQ